MIRKVMLAAFAAATLILASQGASLSQQTNATRPYDPHTQTPPSIPEMQPVAIDAFNPAPNPDATACANIYDSVRDNTETAATPSPYPCSASVTYKYIDVSILTCSSPPTCNTHAQTQIYGYVNGVEDAWAHGYNHPLVPAFRYINGAKQYLNTGNRLYDDYLTTNVFGVHNSVFFFPVVAPGTTPISPWLDTTMVDGTSSVGGSPPFSEYGSGSGVNAGYANVAGSGTYSVGISWEQAISRLVNSVPRDENVTINGFGPATTDIVGCVPTGNGNCRDQLTPDFINNQYDLTDLCGHLRRRLDRIFFEHPLLHENVGSPTNPGNPATAQTIVGDANTIAELYTGPLGGYCNKTKIVDAEFPITTTGTVSTGYGIRTEATAFDALFYNPQTGMPDRVVRAYSGVEGLDQPGDVPVFSDQLIVFVGGEIPYGPPVFNGTTQGLGANCESNGDSGGAAQITVQCVGVDPIMCQQYAHAYWSQTDVGPAAVCLNTSATTETVVAGWFARGGSDPGSTYTHMLNLSGGELTCVPYAGVNDPSAAANCPAGNSIGLNGCTSAGCTGTSAYAGQIAAFTLGTTTLAGGAGIVLFK